MCVCVCGVCVCVGGLCAVCLPAETFMALLAWCIMVFSVCVVYSVQYVRMFILNSNLYRLVIKMWNTHTFSPASMVGLEATVFVGC